MTLHTPFQVTGYGRLGLGPQILTEQSVRREVRTDKTGGLYSPSIGPQGAPTSGESVCLFEI